MKRLSFLLLLLLVPLQALAQAVEVPPAADDFDKTLVGALLGALLGLIPFLVRFFGSKSKFITERAADIAKFGELGYLAVQDLVLRTKNKYDDKALEALKIINQTLLAMGKPALTPAEEAELRLKFSALHGAELGRAQELKAAVSPQ